MMVDRTGRVSLISCCAAIFWPGAFIFGFPGVVGSYWATAFHVGRGAVGGTLFFVLFGAGSFMYFTGRWQERLGPRRLFALGSLLCGASAVMVGQASNMGLVYLCSFIFGISSSFIYIPGLTVVQRWFPHRRGLVSGLVNMVFGLSAAVMSPVFNRLLIRIGYAPMTIILGIIALIMGLSSALCVSLPETSIVQCSVKPGDGMGGASSLTVFESLRSKSFWSLWFTWALAGAAGIALVPLSTAFGLAKGLGIHRAVMILTAFNLTNGLGRLISGHLSDIFGRNGTMTVAFLAAGLAYVLLPHLDGLAVWAVLAAVVGFAFGTLFAVSAPLATDCFGMTHFGAIFGLVFTAYGFVAGPLGPWLSGHVLDSTQGDFQIVFTYLGVFFFVSALLIWFARPPKGVAVASINAS